MGPECAILHHRLSHQQRTRTQVHGACMASYEVVGVNRLTAQFGIEVEASGRETAAAYDGVHGQRELG